MHPWTEKINVYSTYFDNKLTKEVTDDYWQISRG